MSNLNIHIKSNKSPDEYNFKGRLIEKNPQTRAFGSISAEPPPFETQDPLTGAISYQI